MIIPYIGDHEKVSSQGDDVGSMAINALRMLGDCSSLPSVRQLVFGPGSNPSTGQIGEGLAYISECADERDLPLIGSKLNQYVDKLNADSVSNWEVGLLPAVQALYARYAGRSLPILREVLTRGLVSGENSQYYVGRFARPELVPTVRGALFRSQEPGTRAALATILADAGDVAGVSAAAEIVQDSGKSPRARTEALRAFNLYTGPAVRNVLMEVLKTVRADQPEVRAGTYGALRWDEDDQTLGILLQGFNDRDDVVRSAALRSFVGTGSERKAQWLRSRMDSLSPEARVYAARALQCLGGTTDGSAFSQTI